MDQVRETTTMTPLETGQGLTVRRLFTTPEEHPFNAVEWELRDARIGHGDKVSFEQRDVEFPVSWSQNATNIVAQKYFRGQLSSPARERSVRQMIGRVAGTIAGWGRDRGYFATDEAAQTFEADYAYPAPPDGGLQQPRVVQRRMAPRGRPEEPGERGAWSSRSRTT